MRIRWDDDGIEEVRNVVFVPALRDTGDEDDWKVFMQTDTGDGLDTVAVIDSDAYDSLDEAMTVAMGIVDLLMENGYVDLRDAMDEYGLQVL